MSEITNLSITRNELLQHKRQIELTRAGFNLLDKKRIALLQEILRIQDEVVQNATELEARSAKSRRALAKAEALVGEAGVRAAAMGKKREIKIDMEDSLLMGVHIPRLRVESAEREFYDRDIGITGTSPVIDEAAEAFERNLDALLKLADGEIQLGRLLSELNRTTRRLRALEHIIIPKLQSEMRYISHALDERERSEHYSLKLAKKLLEKKYSAKRSKGRGN
ncbi:MAG: V-type ATP synthase subunit D [Chloroflexi bacterium]|nr:V-type ATP synthase subunit D [Chloroflexota bacterium]